jgi:hypothetical protein
VDGSLDPEALTILGDVLEASSGRLCSWDDKRDAARFRVSRYGGEGGFGKDEAGDEDVHETAGLEALEGCF